MLQEGNETLAILSFSSQPTDLILCPVVGAKKMLELPLTRVSWNAFLFTDLHPAGSQGRF
jgi:hypothetical protein